MTGKLKKKFQAGIKSSGDANNLPADISRGKEDRPGLK